MIGSRFCGPTLHITQSVLTLNSNVSRVVTGIANRLYYSKNKGQKTCCENVPQTSGRKVEVWPKPDPPPPAWRCECPSEPQPPNNDPYRIKVPDVVVPPMPPSNAKWSGMVFMTTDRDAEARQRTEQQQYQKQMGMQSEETVEEDAGKKEGFMGLLKGFLEKLGGGKKKGEGDAMMLDSRDFQWIYRW
ncbi:unnamed protein product [Arctia plantaginis]|uniref:Uncharacterized protein n=1 Tax=Arctia plantaginis TaxID=874455 RepID=A0A8S0ZM07_ARCPL|nr:unnamed protein product [Arctia plantaginis]CAB3237599.1 unnamed protein product [Arctia plantaginis]